MYRSRLPSALVQYPLSTLHAVLLDANPNQFLMLNTLFTGASFIACSCALVVSGASILPVHTVLSSIFLDMNCSFSVAVYIRLPLCLMDRQLLVARRIDRRLRRLLLRRVGRLRMPWVRIGG